MICNNLKYPNLKKCRYSSLVWQIWSSGQVFQVNKQKKKADLYSKAWLLIKFICLMQHLNRKHEKCFINWCQLEVNKQQTHSMYSEFYNEPVCKKQDVPDNLQLQNCVVLFHT